MSKLTKKQLQDYYITQNMRVQEIADFFGVHKGTIERRLKKHSIKKSQAQSKQLARQTNVEKYGVPIPMQPKQIDGGTLENLSSYEFMCDHYIVKNMSVKEISKLLSVSTSVIWGKLKERDYANEFGLIKIYDAGQRLYLRNHV